MLPSPPFPPGSLRLNELCWFSVLLNSVQTALAVRLEKITISGGRLTTAKTIFIHICRLNPSITK